jgi:hypothetical protein
MKTYTITIENGCTRDLIDAPHTSGIVFIYLQITRSDNKIYYDKLLEITSTDDISSFLTENVDSWVEEIIDRTRIKFTWAVMNPNIRTRILAGLINFYRPVLNENFLDYFPFERTEIICEGNNALLQKKIIVGE